LLLSVLRMLLSLQGKRLHSPTLWLGAAGLGFMAVLMAKRVKGALMLGIVFTTAISWIPGHAASYLGAGSQVPGGRGRPCHHSMVHLSPNHLLQVQLTLLLLQYKLEWQPIASASVSASG
jgi:xanthine/uracil/vitamin C permease (AzgA family)